MSKFRKKPVVIDAEQWLGSKESWDKIMAMGLTNFKPGEMGAKTFLIETLEGDMLAQNGDWVIKGVSGEFYPVKPDIFDKTYEPVTDAFDGTKKNFLLDDEAGHILPVVTDSDRLDKLQNLSTGYGTGWILRKSGTFRGMRLHESTHDGGSQDIRHAIDAYIPPVEDLKFTKTP